MTTNSTKGSFHHIAGGRESIYMAKLDGKAWRISTFQSYAILVLAYV